MQPLVFISYSSKDSLFAKEIDQYLQRENLSTWFAAKDLEAGASFAERIAEGIKKADLVVVIFTSNSNASPHVALELNLAISSGKKVFPIRLEPVEPIGALKYFLGLSQWIDISLPLTKSFPGIISGINKILTGPGAALQARSTRVGTPIILSQLLSQRDAMLIGNAYAELVLIHNKIEKINDDIVAWLSYLGKHVKLLSDRLRLKVELICFQPENLFIFKDTADFIKVIREVTDQLYYQLDSKHDIRTATALNLLFGIGVSALYISHIDEAQRIQEINEWSFHSKNVELSSTAFQQLLTEVRNNQNTIEAILEFRSHCVSFIEDQMNYEPEFAQYRSNIWKMGATISLVSAVYPLYETTDPLKKLLSRAQIYADTINITIPSFPVKTNDRISDDASMLHYLLHELGEKFVLEMKILYGEGTSALFEASVKSSIILILYGEDYTEGDLITVTINALERSLNRSAIPSDLWSSLVESVRTHQPYDIIKEEITNVQKDVGDYLSGIVVSSRSAKT